MDIRDVKHGSRNSGTGSWNKRPYSSKNYDSEPRNKYSRPEISPKGELLTPDSPEQNFDLNNSSGNSSTASSNKTFLCRLCNNDTSFKKETDFDIHLTVIHFRERLMKQIQEPFRCFRCGYVPMPPMTPEEQGQFPQNSLLWL